MTEPIIAAQQLVKRFGRGRKAVEALRGIDLDFASGRVTGLVGPNGAGKSTFIKTALGFLQPTGGHVRVLGRPPGDAEALARLGYLPENPSFPQFLSGAEFLRYVAGMLGIRGRRATVMVDDLLEEVGIAHAKKRRVWSYSKGMAQRLGLAQALIGDPELLIFDEPMSGLDPIGRAHVKQILRARKHAGATIVFCSHILEDVERLCEDIVMIHQGQVQYRGPLADVLVSDDQRWNALIRVDELPDTLANFTWQAVGTGLWSAVDLDEPQVRVIKQASLDGRIAVVRLNQEIDDLEDVFIRIAAPETEREEGP